MNNIFPISSKEIINSGINNNITIINNTMIYNFTPYQLRKIFCKLPTSLILVRIQQIKEHIKSEIIKKKIANKESIDHNTIDNNIDLKINSSLENIKYEIFADNQPQLSEMTINFLRMLLLNINLNNIK